MDVGRTEGVGGPGRVEGPKKPSSIKPTQPPASPSKADSVEISEGARLVSEAMALPQTRAERIEEVKKLIESGRFENDERLNGSVEQFLRENPDLLA